MTQEEAKELGLNHIEDYLYGDAQHSLEKAVSSLDFYIDKTLEYMVFSRRHNSACKPGRCVKEAKAYLEDAERLYEAASHENIVSWKDHRFSLWQRAQRAKERLEHVCEIEKILQEKEEVIRSMEFDYERDTIL